MGKWARILLMQDNPERSRRVFPSIRRYRLASRIQGTFQTIRQRFKNQRAEAAYLNVERLRTELEKEKEQNALRQRLISAVGHDVRTSLAVLRTSNHILSRYFERISPEERLKHLRNIEVHIGYINHLFDTLSLADRAHSGQLEPELGPVDVVPFCRAILEQAQGADESGHQFVFNAQGGMAGFLTDVNLLRRILLNLLSNAVKYSPAGSEIRLEVSVENQEVLLRVSDQGIGIPAIDRERIFDWFQRASNTGQISGTGLGLAIVKSAVDALGGSVTFSSQLGQGTTFSVHLPTGSIPSEGSESGIV